jgi:hypothetical protein
MTEQAEFASLDEFIAADVRRWTSQKADYGSMWRDVGGRLWRVLYVRATGEVYATEAVRVNGRVRLLAVVHVAEEPRTPAGRNIRPSAVWYRNLDRLLGNYASPEETRNFSLVWLEEQLTPPLGSAHGKERENR